MMPNLVLFREDLTADAKLVYLGLRSYAWQKESCFPGQTALAKRLGLSRRTVQRGLAQLQEKGLLRVEHRGFAETNRYVLLKLT